MYVGEEGYGVLHKLREIWEGGMGWDGWSL